MNKYERLKAHWDKCAHSEFSEILNYDGVKHSITKIRIDDGITYLYFMLVLDEDEIAGFYSSLGENVEDVEA